MRSISASARRAVFMRSFGVQGSWNFRSLLGPGFAFAIRPALREIHRDPAALEAAEVRHTALFNCHPYLSPMALGAVATMEAAGEDPAMIDRFKAAIRGSLGTLGDRVVWAGWRPVCLLLAILLLLLDAPWWLAIGAFLVLYNAGHIALRVWSFRLGLREGRRLAERLRNIPIGEAQRVLATTGGFLVGMLIPLAASGAMVDAELGWGWSLAALAAAALGARYGARSRAVVVYSLFFFTAIGILIEVMA